MELPSALLAAFPPVPYLLLNVAGRSVDDAMLLEIAQADYENNADLHLAALRTIRDQGALPSFPPWNPREVLELIQWCDPDNPCHQPGSPGRRGHQMRAFACAALLQATVEAGGSGVGEATLAQFLRSAQVLGDELVEVAASFLTWGIPRIETNDRWLYAFGLLSVATHLRAGRISDRDLGDAATWVLAEEAELQRTIRPSCPPPTSFGLSMGVWKPLAADLIRNAATIRASDVRKQIEFIGEFVQNY